VLSRNARVVSNALFTPPAMLLLRLRVSPDAVTVVGTLGAVAAALVLYPRGELFWGSFVVTLFVCSDMLDGIMARTLAQRGVVRSGRWGAFLDSTLDRFADSAIFAGLAIWFVRDGDDALTAGLALLCLVLGSLVSYAKARAEGLGFTANVGIAERSDRLVAVLVGAGFVGLGVPQPFLTVVLGLLAVASLVTVGQRMATVHRQAAAALGDA